MSIPCWHEQKNDSMDDKMRNNDPVKLKLSTMVNIDVALPIPAGVFEIDA